MFFLLMKIMIDKNDVLNKHHILKNMHSITLM